MRRLFTSKSNSKYRYDAIILGAGHNGSSSSYYFLLKRSKRIRIFILGLITASYLSKSGMRVLVLEKRPFVGGAAVTEKVNDEYLSSLGLEVKMSRASYLAGLLRPVVIQELGLETLFTYLPRNPSSFTPTRC